MRIMVITEFNWWTHTHTPSLVDFKKSNKKTITKRKNLPLPGQLVTFFNNKDCPSHSAMGQKCLLTLRIVLAGFFLLGSAISANGSDDLGLLGDTTGEFPQWEKMSISRQMVQPVNHSKGSIACKEKKWYGEMSQLLEPFSWAWARANMNQLREPIHLRNAESYKWNC